MSERPYVQYVEANIKGGVGANLGPKTLIVGPNGSGKTAIVQAIELALTGRVSDLQARETAALEIELMNLATDRESELHAYAKLSDGSEGRYATGLVANKKSGDVKARKKEHAPPRRSVHEELSFPLRPILDAVRGKPETARKFFLQHLTGNISLADIEGYVTERLRGHFDSIWNTIDRATPVVDALIFTIAKASENARSEGQTGKGGAALANTVAARLPALPTEAEYNAALAEVETAKRALEAAAAAEIRAQAQAQTQAQLGQHYETMRAQRETIAQQNAANEKRRGQLTLELQGLQSSIAGREQWLAGAKPYHAQLVEWLRQQEEGTSGADPVLKAAIVVAKDRFEALSKYGPTALHACPACMSQVGAQNFKQAALTAETLLAARANNKTQLAPYVEQRDTLAKQIDETERLLATERQRYPAALAELEQTPFPAALPELPAPPAPIETLDSSSSMAPPVNIELVREQLRLAENKVRQFDNAKVQYGTMREAKATAVEAELESATWATLVDQLNEAVAGLLDKVVEAYVAEVQSYLPPTDKFSLRLRDGTREVFQYGLVVDGKLRTALSGAEEVRVLGAMAAAIGARNPGMASIVALRDRSYDPDTLTGMLTSLTLADAQIIVQSAVRPTSVPLGWTVIDTTPTRV